MDTQNNTNRLGSFIVLEGTDGSGKGTQFRILSERLQSAGYDVALFDFPRYDDPSSYFVKKYLNGQYGSAESVGPYAGSLFYALDRYDIANEIRAALDQGKVVLANRFTGSNMAHQGTKIANTQERRGYFIWLDNLEFEMLKIPRPTLNIVLRVPAEVAQQLVDQKEQRNYTDKKRDIHEADLSHMRRSVEVYDNLCQLFPQDFHRIDCIRDGQLLDIDTVADILWKKLSPLLPEPDQSTSPKKEPVMQLPAPDSDNKYLSKDADGNYTITEQGQTYLAEAVSDATSDVYTFSDQLSPVTVAAAMARLSRRGDDMRVTLLDEFADKAGKDGQLLKRVITAFGDDSVQQLAGQHIVIENASNLLTKKLEWGRLAAYLEQSTRYIYFDKKDASGHYKYFTPTDLDDATKRTYQRAMNAIFGTYSKIVHDLTEYIRTSSDTSEDERDGAWKSATKAQACDAARPLLPVATRATVGIFASGQALESLIMHLLADELPEARSVGQQILEQARKTMPVFLERADKPERGGAMVAYLANTKKSVKDLADKYLKANYSNSNADPVQLTDYWPKNELDIVPDMLYEHSDLSLKDLRNTIDDWSYQQKLDVASAYMGERLNRRHRPGRALEKVHYSWDIVCDYGIFRDLQRHRMVDDLEWQILTPRQGYDVPKLIEEAGLVEDYENCFEISLKLHSLLQEKGYELESQYATLLGHKMRWKVTMNAREAFHFNELRTSPQGHPGYRKLVMQMYEKMAEVHPILAGHQIFVNRAEDPVLTRLAAERYTQFKLEELDKQNQTAREKLDASRPK